MTDTDISQKILERVKFDQNFRLSPDIENKTLEDFLEIDNVTLILLKEIVSEVGAITISRFGKDISHNAWLLVQHCDHDETFQENYLNLMLQNPSDFSKVDIAYLTDRVAINRDRPQIYATQFLKYEGGKYKPMETIDPKNVDKRRQEVGIITLKEYAAEFPDSDVSDFYPQN